MQPRWHLLNPGLGDSINIFFAGAGFTHDLAYDAGVRKRLLSWHANSEDEIADYAYHQENGRHTFGIVDSGAFSCWNKGDDISLVEYSENLYHLLESFDIAANLDVIPGKQGMAAADITPKMKHDAAAEGWKNYQYLANYHGKHRIMPVFHQGEDIVWLKRMVDAGCDYIGISPSNDYHTGQRMYWLDEVFTYLTSLPKLPKTHGYAVTSPILMQSYPWFSVDSASWVHKGAMGMVSTDIGDVVLTNRDETMLRKYGYDTPYWTPEMKQKLDLYCQRIGTTVTELRNSYHARWRANAIMLLEYEQDYRYVPRKLSDPLFC